MAKWTVANIPSQKGKLAVVTGATGGLGYETALGLAHAGAEVVLAGRNRAKGADAVDKITRALPEAKVRFEMLDLASLESVRAFAQAMVARGRQLDLLINNAGVMQLPERRLNADGVGVEVGTNHLSHFVLTGLVLPLMRTSQSAT